MRYHERYEQLEKYFTWLSSQAPRLSSGAIDWDSWYQSNTKQADEWVSTAKHKEKVVASMSRLEEKYHIDSDKVWTLFRSSQYSYSQSF